METTALTGAFSSGRQKDARRRTKLAAGGAFGSRRMSTVILPPSERGRDGFLAVFIVLSVSGILPALACAALGALFDVIGWWLVYVGLAALLAAFFRWVWSL